jgi:hypothetical protein
LFTTLEEAQARRKSGVVETVKEKTTEVGIGDNKKGEEKKKWIVDARLNWLTEIEKTAFFSCQNQEVFDEKKFP